jgi:taurine dioxygenase
VITAHRHTAALGASIDGVRLDEIDRSVADEIYELLIEHQVLFFREQHLGPDEQAAFGSSMGELGARHHSYRTHPDNDDVVVIEWEPGATTDAAEWHSDMTFTQEPPFASILQAIVVPPVGGDTLWASMYAVHDRLDPGFRRDLEVLDAVHDPGAFRNGPYRDKGNAGINELLGTVGSAVWPIISHHPVTGRPYVNVSESNTRWIIGLGAAESNRILTMLFDYTNRPDHHVRLRWEPGTVAMWDNRATQHYAVADFPKYRRVMHRVAVARDTRAGQPA